MNEVTKRFPWEPAPVEETIALLQKDFAYAVTHTAVLVRSNRIELRMLANTPRGQIIPQGECKFTDGSAIEFQDIGMPQPNVPTVATIGDLMARVWDAAHKLGLDIVP